MAGLTRNPDDELLRVIRSLESRVRTLETQRSRPAYLAGAGFLPNQSLPSSTTVVLDMDSVIVDPLGMVDLGADEIVVPASGCYLVVLGVTALPVSPSVTSGQGSVYLNGSFAHAGVSFGNTGTGVSTTVALMLSAGDALSARFRSEGAASTTSTGVSSFLLAVRLSD